MHGVKRLFSWMIPRFDRDRFDVSLVSLRKKDLSEETLDSLGIDITYLERSKFDPLTLSDLLRVVDRKRIDILHLHGYGATTFGRLAGAVRAHSHNPARTREPHRHSVVPEDRRPTARAHDRHCIGRLGEHRGFRRSSTEDSGVQGQGGLSGGAAEEFSRAGAPPSVAAARTELGIEPQEFAVGTITRLHESKGNSYLIDAAARVITERPNVRFFLVGEGPLLHDLQAQAAGLELGNRFVFGGFHRNVARTLSAFDLSVFPSLWEGTPITAFEALAMGKPIVATDADGLLDILTDGHDAMIVPKRDAAALCTLDRLGHGSS